MHLSQQRIIAIFNHHNDAVGLTHKIFVKTSTSPTQPTQHRFFACSAITYLFTEESILRGSFTALTQSYCQLPAKSFLRRIDRICEVENSCISIPTSRKIYCLPDEKGKWHAGKETSPFVPFSLALLLFPLMYTPKKTLPRKYVKVLTSL